MKLTDRDYAYIIKDGLFHITLPDVTAESGYRSYKLNADKYFVNRGTLFNNSAYNAEPYQVYSTNVNTLQLPDDANKIGTLEAFGNTDIDLRYSTYTFGVFEMWGIKKTGSTWGTWTKISVGISDHGELDGLGDDDHPQYFNQVRGDARYLRIGEDISENMVVLGNISLSGNINQTGTA
ncbi:MAG: hypothetical protein P1P88_23720, partial [Bacteroidales bacterium]|nr:hypothetical protein [Bacteroidales bacterium]